MAKTEKELEGRVLEALESARPMLQMDGGDLEYVGIDDELKVHINLVGACGGCGLASSTLKMGIEQTLIDAVPEITGVIQDNEDEESFDEDYWWGGF